MRNVSPFVLTVFVCFNCFDTAHGEVLEVPVEFPTIQSALVASETGDTVRVAPGEYHEFLNCSTDSIVIMGWYSADTLMEFRTLLNPLPIGVDTPSALILTGNYAEVHNFAFFNEPEMRELEWPTRTGGIEHTGLRLSVTDCRFDSVSRGVRSDFIRATRCVFEGGLWNCLYASNFGTVEADSCVFESAHWDQVFAGSGSTIQNCTFSRNDSFATGLLRLHGTSIHVRNCNFGPCDWGLSPVFVSVQGEITIEECVFENIRGVTAIIEVAMQCPIETDTPLVIRNNVFRDYHWEGVRGGAALAMGCQTPNAGYFGLIEGNTFSDGSAIDNNPGIRTNGSITLRNNVFERLDPQDFADVYSLRNSQDTVFARDNSFLPPGLAAASEANHFDARLNWWGDSTGPFHASLNPTGLGSEVGNDVWFVPWLSSPDSIDTTSIAVDVPNGSRPSEYLLSSYPNPFNAVTTLVIDVARAGEFEVLLYDVTGRVAANVFSGRIATSQQVSVDAAGLASGIYFAQLRGGDGVLAVEKLLLVR